MYFVDAKTNPNPALEILPDSGTWIYMGVQIVYLAALFPYTKQSD